MVIEGTGLVEHLLRKPDLSDVVELARREQLGAVVPVDAKLVSDGVAEVNHVVTVRARAAAARLQRRGRHGHCCALCGPGQILLVSARVSAPVALAAPRSSAGREIAVLPVVASGSWPLAEFVFGESFA